MISPFFFFNDTATTEIYTLSLHDALPISLRVSQQQTLRQSVSYSGVGLHSGNRVNMAFHPAPPKDRKSTRLNSSHLVISYAVFCLKKKNNADDHTAVREPKRHVAQRVAHA